MAVDHPFALLITWTCYGSWLQGDRRGYVSVTLGPEGRRTPKQNVTGTPYSSDNAYTRKRARQRQKWPTVILTQPQAELLAQRMVGAATERNWRLAILRRDEPGGSLGSWGCLPKSAISPGGLLG